MEVTILKPQIADIKVFKLCLKVCDEFAGVLTNHKGDSVSTYEGYVPEFFPANGGGDYVNLDIDLESGVILNWKVPTRAQLEGVINGGEN